MGAFTRITPYYTPITATEGAGISKENPAYTTGLAYPYLLAKEDQDEELIYYLTKEIHLNFEKYQDVHPLLPLWELETAITPDYMVAPVHKGAVKYFEDIGWWSEEHEAKQQALLEREGELSELWEKEKGKLSEFEDSTEFTEYWIERKKRFF